MLLLNSITSLNSLNYSINIRRSNIEKTLCFTFILIVFILFLLKFIGNFWVINFLSLNAVSTLKYCGVKYINTLNPTYSIFSDIIVLLCVVVTYITLTYLSDRGVVENTFNIVYFLIFIIFTINMVYSISLLTMFIFFELIFLPSLYFVYQTGYSEEVDKTIKYLLL